MKKTLTERFAYNLRESRLEKGVSQKEMSMNVETSQQTFSKYELGVISPTLRIVEKMAIYLEIEPYELLK